MDDWYKPNEIEKPNLIYLDIWVYRKLIDNPEYLPKFIDYLQSNLLFPAISDIIMLELSPKSQYWIQLDTLLPVLNSILVKKFDIIIDDEVSNYPYEVDRSIIEKAGYLLPHLLTNEITKKLASPQTYEDWKEFRSYASKMEYKMKSAMYGYPTDALGKYSLTQAYDFSKLRVMNWLSETHPRFIRPHLKNYNDFKPEAIQTIQLFSYYVFYKFFNGRRTPKKLSEFGDLFHLFYLPYCTHAILERDQCHFLRGIQRNQEVLSSVTLFNIDFFDLL